jgi:CubicO group peptidase (beta-lactamase class C family)
MVAAVLAASTAVAGGPVQAQEPPAPAAAPPAPPPVASTPVPNPAPTVRRAPRPARAAVAAPAAAAAQAVAPPAAPTGPAGARLATGQPIPQAELEAFVDGAVRDAMAADHVPGVVVAVVQTGQPAFRKGYGYADLEAGRPMDPDRTLVRLGSISKTFTWILLMRQVENGRMGLNNPVNQYLPSRCR